jgi:hypothetical protein
MNNSTSKNKRDMTTIAFSDIKIYLDAIAAKTGIDMGGTPHNSFWNIPYANFVTGNIPHVKCNGNPIPIINRIVDPATGIADPLKSSFYLILIAPNGFCGKRQMPDGGPYITDANYQITLPDGSTLTGQQVQDNIKSWLLNGLPETLPIA